jgi:hypothetical protein
MNKRNNIMNANELIDNLIDDTHYLIKQVEENILPLPKEVINFKTSEETWSILECIEHINIANKHYHDQIGAKLRDQNTTPKETYSGGALGNYFTKMMKPKEDKTIPGKMKTISKFYPVISLQSGTPYQVIESFLKDQQRLLGLLDKAKSANLAKIKIKSALGAWLMFKLGDAFRFMIAHSERHVLQAMNTLEEYQRTVSES